MFSDVHMNELKEFLSPKKEVGSTPEPVKSENLNESGKSNYSTIK